jgi:hypothetical protein
MHAAARRRRQQGAVIITVALFTLFLLGFMGLALDFGHLFVVKTELQTAMDSCALAAAQELDGAADARDRATRAGRTAGNLNKVNFQGAAAGIVDEDVTFSDTLIGTYSHTFTPVASAKYAKCTHSKSGMAPWLLQAMSAFSGDAAYAASQSVFALAVASRTPAQSSCAIPVQINPKNSTPPNYGFVPGEWIPTLYDETSSGPSDTTPGHFGWANLDGNGSSGSELKAELLGNGVCKLSIDTPSTPGTKFAGAVEWNSRFGLYKNGAGQPNIDTAMPDLTGYAYTKDGAVKSWPSGSNAVSDFLAKRATNRSYGDTVDSVNTGDSLTGLNIKGGYKDADMGTFAAGARSLATHGGDRRLVPAPIVSSGKIAAFACVLMLHPIDSNKTTVYLEYVGNASNPASPCATVGLPGGAGGPLVPVLVQ